MSFTDIRKFVAIMKVLGYPHSISMDSFRTPNFELVADCLHWLIVRYDPTVDLDTDVSIEGRRVAFLKRATQIMLSGARIKLNPRRLYSADGYAVKELLKVASLLHHATEMASVHENEIAELGPSIKAFDVKATRLLVSEITKCGASLHDILEMEPSLQESRSRATMMNTDMDEIERGLKEAISALLESISSAEQEQANTKRDEETLQAKVEKRKFELERSEKRLSTLHNVRPAYMDEYEVLQTELHGLFAEYSEKFRNLQWLQSQMEGHTQEEQEKLEESDRRMRRLQRKLHEEELSILRGEEVDGSLANQGSSEESDGEGTMFWKWFDGSSFKSILEPGAKAEQHTSKNVGSDRMLTKGPMEWMSHTKGGLKALSMPCSASISSLDRNQATIKNSLKAGTSTKPRTADSLQASDSDISVGLEGDDELLDMDVADPKDTGDEVTSSDEDF